jgi:hypothetical protein
MGMDVVGIAPRNKTGEYFRNNVWYWRPLWEYCEVIDPTLEEKVPNAHYNAGDGLKTAEECIALANKLMDSVNLGIAERYRQAREQWLDSLEGETCDICEGTGIRTDLIGQEQGMSDKVLDETAQVVLNRERGWCNGCEGKGEKPNWNSHYPFEVSNVIEFAEFLKYCGGFEIC